MAGPVNTTNIPSNAPGAVAGVPPTEGFEQLEGEVRPGEDIPLPTGADGKLQTTGSGTLPPGEGVQVQQGAPETAPPTSTTRTQPPTSAQFTNDSVDTSRTPPSTTGESNATRPFGDYNLPESDLKVEGQSVGDTEGLHASVTAAVTDIVKGLFADPTAMHWAQDRAQFLTQNPTEGVLTQLTDTEGAKALGTGLLEVLDFSRLSEGLNAQFGEGTQALLDTSRQTAFDLILGNGVLGGQLDFNKLVTDFSTRFHTQSGEGAFGLTTEDAASADSSTPVIDASTLFNADGTLNQDAVAKLGPAMASLLEASIESMISLAGHLLKGDIGKDIDMMSARLKELKEEKKLLAKQLIEKEGSIMGIMRSSTEAVKRANDAAECAKTWKMIGAIVAIVVVVIVAIVVTVFTCGAGGPAAIAGAAAVIGITIAATSTAAVALSIALAVAAITVAVITIVQAVPMILQALAMLFKALGMPEVAENLETWAADYQKFMDESGLGTALTVISIACSLFMAVIMLPMSAAALGAAAGSTMAAAGNMLQVVGLVGLVGGVLAGTCNVVSAVYSKQFAKIQYEMELLRARLAEIELEIKTIMHTISQRKTEEEEVKDDIAARQEMEGRMMETLNKCAESLKTLLNAATLS